MTSRRRARPAPSAAAEAVPGDATHELDGGDAAKRHHTEGAGLVPSADRADDAPAPRVDCSEHGSASDSAAGEELAATGGHGEHLQETPPSGTIAPRAVLLVPAVA